MSRGFQRNRNGEWEPFDDDLPDPTAVEERVFGNVRRWRDGERLWAENDWVTMVYVVTDDTELVGSVGLHGEDQMCVEFISPQTAELWD